MENTTDTFKNMMLSQQIQQAYLAPKGYDAFSNLHSHDARSLYDSYLHPNKNIASCLTHQNIQISFIAKFSKDWAQNTPL